MRFYMEINKNNNRKKTHDENVVYFSFVRLR